MKKSIKSLLGKVSAKSMPRRGKPEVLFLAHKADMWDAMESIYEAAMRDDSVDVRVVVVPWYERKADLSMGAMHYEAARFPSDVEITPWDSYDISWSMPEIVFFSNPCDEFNAVSMIHPRYFIRAIRPFVRLLVYVPYYVAVAGHIPEDSAVQPGTDVADVIIVDSVETKELYRKQIMDRPDRNKFKRIMKKVLPLGSPKFDRVMNLRPSDYEMPTDWKEKVTRPDGTRKKIILYNVSLQALYNAHEAMIEKIERNVEYFSRRRDDVTLLWRPHPLYVETMRKAVPEMVGRYEGIVDKYKSEGWGIYDDSSLLYRAIAVSDAYYGDWSSLVPLYEKTGKPIMIQNAAF